MMCWSYGVFFALPSASFSLAMASGICFFCRASCAAFRDGASSLETLFLSFSLSAAKAGPETRTAEAATVATPRTCRLVKLFTFIVGPLIVELGCIYKADLLHSIPLGRGQNLSHIVVLGTTIGAQVDFRLHVLLRFLAEVAFQLTEALHHGS